MPTVSDYTALLSGQYWSRFETGTTVPGQPVFLTYSFATAAAAYQETALPGITGNVTAFTAAQKQEIRDALAQYAAAAGIAFYEVPEGQGTLTFTNASFSHIAGTGGEAGLGFSPGFTALNTGSGFATLQDNRLSGDVFFNSDIFGAGSLAAYIPLHEIGHALGFKHSFDASNPNNPLTLDAAHENHANTVMSYSGPDPLTLGPLDIAGMQAIYGSTAARDAVGATWNAATYVLTRSYGAGADLIRGISTGDSIHGGDGDDTISGLGGNDTLFGDGGLDYIAAGDGNDSVDAGAGNDTLNGGAGADTLDGGAGVNVVDYGADSAQLGATGLGVTVNLTSGFATDGFGATDRLFNIQGVYGGVNADSLYGSAGADTFYGASASDYINGQAGGDLLVGDNFGDTGNDTLIGGLGSDTLFGGDGSDFLVGGDFTAADAGQTDNLYGEAGNDRVYAYSGASALLDGGAGNDTLVGAGGNDSFNGGAGVDYLDGGAGINTVYYSADAFAGGGAGVTVNLAFNYGRDGFGTLDSLLNIQVVVGTDAGDLVIGASGAESMFGGNANDYVNMGAGADYILDFGGANSLLGGLGSDTIIGGGGNDLMVGGQWTAVDAGVTDYLYGGGGNDRLYTGSSGNGVLFGEAGNDTLGGSTGNDYLYGGLGSDVLAGGTGVETFYTASTDMQAGDVDYVAGFHVGDVFGFSAALSGQVNFSQSGSTVYMSVALGGSNYWFEGVANATVAQVQAATSFYG